jgi:transposase
MKRRKCAPVSEQRVLRLISRQLNAEPRVARKHRIAKKWSNEAGQMKRMKQLMTRKLGAGPILQHFIKQMGVVSMIDELVPAHEARTISHGEAVAGLMVYLLNGGRALYRMEQWAESTAVLSTLFPEYGPEDWSDDRLGDTLEALHKQGLEGLQGSLSAHLVEVFGLCLELIHYDTTSVSFWGTYDSQSGQPAVVLTFGYSKDHRPDLKQVVLGAAVSGDGGVPLLSKTHDGNSNDSTLPVPYWERLRQLCGTSRFCFIGDCKVASQETLKTICSQDGLFLSPLAMSTAEQESLRKRLKDGTLIFEPLEQEEQQKLKPIYEKRTARVGNRRKSEREQPADTYEVYEESTELYDHRKRGHTIRRLILRSASLGRKHANTRERHLQQAETELKELRGKLNKRKLKTRPAIEVAVNKILAHRKVVGLLEVSVEEERKILTKQVGRGRPGPNTKYVEEQLLSYDLKMTHNQDKINDKALLDGVFILATNQEAQEWPAPRILAVYKRQYKVERVFHVLKGPLAVSPMLLEKPERICAMLFIMTLTLQLYTLIQRQAAQELEKRERPLSGLMPNKIQTWRPQTDTLLAAFNNIDVVAGYHDGMLMAGITTLNATQVEILQILGVPLEKYAFT